LIRRVVWSAWWLGLGLRILQLWLSTHPDPHRVFMAFGIGPLTFAASVVFGMSASTVGLIMASRLPANRFGWVWVAVGMTQGILATLLLLAADRAADSSLGVLAGLIASVGVAQAPFLATALGLLTFPTGTFIDRRWRIVGVAVLVAIGLRGLEVAFGSPNIFLLPTVANPLVAGPPFGPLIRGSQQLGLGVSLVLVTVSACLASVVVRYRRADEVGRRQIRWFLLGASLFVLTLVPAAYIYLVVGALEERAASIFALNFLGFSLVPITTLVAITRYRLYEIDRIVNRALLYGSLTAILAGVFTAGISLAQRTFIALTGESSDVAIVLTTLVVATLYAPLRKRLEAIVDRRFKFENARFGAYRDELSRVLGLVDPEMAAQRLIDEAVAELGAIGGAVLSANGAATAMAGVWPQVRVDQLPIPGGAGGLAAIAIGPRLDGRPHEPAQLDELERVAGMVARATRIAPPARAVAPSAPRGSGTPD
jgi:hypothetical protein